jgi:hypothetical protein
LLLERLAVCEAARTIPQCPGTVLGPKRARPTIALAVLVQAAHVVTSSLTIGSERRRRAVIKDPKEFRGVREDLPKPKKS